MLYTVGDIRQARATLGQALETAEAAGATSVHARIRVLQAEIHATQDGTFAEALQACQATIPVLEADDDLEGLADAWLLVGKLRLWSGDDRVRTKQAVERAADCARRSANYRAEQESAKLLVYNLFDLPIPVDEAVSRAESLLQAASGDSWAQAAILLALSLLYSYAGRFADARAALQQSQSIYAGAGAKFKVALHSSQAGRIELIAGDPAAAEQGMTAGYEVLRAMGECGWRAGAAATLAESLFGNSVAFDQMSAAGWKLVWLGPEVGDQGDLAVFVELEEAQAGLRALLPGELDPAGRVLALGDDLLHRDVPVIGEALHVEPDVGVPAADLLPGLGAAVDHVAGKQCAERLPVPGLCRGPVRCHYFMRVGHARQATRQSVPCRPCGSTNAGTGRERRARRRVMVMIMAQ